MAGILLNRSRQVPAEETPAFGGIAERFRRAGDLDRAVALCRDGLKRFPEQLSAKVTLGWALLDKGQYDDARAELEHVLRKAPDNLAAIRGLAELHDRTEGAVAALDEKHWQPSHDQRPSVVSGTVGAHRETVTAPVVVWASQQAPPSPPPAAALDLPFNSVWAPPADDPFTSLFVSLPADSAATPELLLTAEQAVLVADEAAAGHGVPPHVEPIEVELENLAAASMAAAGAALEPVGQEDAGYQHAQSLAAPTELPADVAAAEVEIAAEMAHLAELTSLTIAGDVESAAAMFGTVGETATTTGELAPEPFSVTFDVSAAPVDQEPVVAGAADLAATLDVSFSPAVSEASLGEATVAFVPTAVSFEPSDASEVDAGPFEEVDIVLGVGEADSVLVEAFELVAPALEDAEPAFLELDRLDDDGSASEEFSSDLLTLTEIAPEPDAAEPVAAVVDMLELPVRPTGRSRVVMARLERFLRQVQTRRLQLRTETVA